jgi:hypothetical protein
MLDLNVSTSGVSLPSATAKTVIQFIGAANNKTKVSFPEVSMDGTSATDKPALVQVMRQTTAIGGTPGAGTVVKRRHGDAGTVQLTAAIYGTSPTEPTASDIYWQGYIHPQSSRVIPKVFEIEQGERLGIVVTDPGTGHNCAVSADAME